MTLNEKEANLSFDGLVNERISDNCSYEAHFSELEPPYSKAACIIVSTIPIVLVLIGVSGNVLTITVILRQWKNITSTGVYLIVLAVSDSIFLVAGTLFDWVNVVFGLNMRGDNAGTCKLTEFLYVACAQFSSWILIAITVDRIIGIVWPLHYKRMCNANTSKVTSLVICVTLVAINGHFFYGFGSMNSVFGIYGESCAPIIDDASYINFYYEFWPWVDLTILFTVPFVVLMVGNTIILARLIQMHYDNKTGNTYTNRPNIRTLSLLIVGLNVVFVISITPLSVFTVLHSEMFAWRDEIICVDPDEFQHRRGVIDLTVESVTCMPYVNPSVNFILYVLSGTKFRNKINALVTCQSVEKNNVFG